METRKISIRTPALLAIGFALLGCGDDGEAGPSGPSIDLDGGGITPLDATSSSDATQAVSDAGAPSGECRGPSGCYSCAPKTNAELLNACAEGCRPFNNAQRLPGFQPGKLPPL